MVTEVGFATRRDEERNAAELQSKTTPRHLQASLAAAAAALSACLPDRAEAGEPSPVAADRATTPVAAASAVGDQFLPAAAASASALPMTNVFAGARSGRPVACARSFRDYEFPERF